jgi:hypothetical protein
MASQVSVGDETLFRQLVATLPADAERSAKLRGTGTKRSNKTGNTSQTYVRGSGAGWPRSSIRSIAVSDTDVRGRLGILSLFFFQKKKKTHINYTHTHTHSPQWLSASAQRSQAALTKQRTREAAEARRDQLAVAAARQREAQARALAAAQAQREAGFAQRLRAFDEETAHARKVEERLMEAEEVKRHKSERLYREWSREVYEPLQSAVRESARALGAGEVRARKRELFEEYLEATRTKRGVFRDVVIEGDYDPFRATREINATRRAIVREAETQRRETEAATGVIAPRSSRRVRDPVKRELTRRREEDELIAEAEGRRLPPVERASGRETLSTALWSKLEATPYGDRPIREREQNRLAKSNVVMDHFTEPTAGEIAMERESVPRGKRTVARGPKAEGVRSGKKSFPNTWRSNVISAVSDLPPPPASNHHHHGGGGNYSVRDNTPFAVDKA